MELYKQKKAEVSSSVVSTGWTTSPNNQNNSLFLKQEEDNVRREEEENTKVQKQEALQLLKRKEKTERIIKVSRELAFSRDNSSCSVSGLQKLYD